jgi:hypothetical protein
MRIEAKGLDRVGTLLMVAGALVGFTLGIAVTAGFDPLHLPWLVSVGLVKLVMLASVGLIGAGAVFKRLATRSERRERDRIG